MDEEIFYYLAFSHFLGIGPVRFFLLLKNFLTAKKAYLANRDKLIKLLGEKLTDKFLKFRQTFDPVKVNEKLKKEKITVLPYFSNAYPSSLKTIADPPICLYVRGEAAIFNQTDKIYFAIVGTRTPSPYGEQVAKKFSFELAKAGFIIVSGMALGIDALSHWAALNAGGKTIAVLGCGVDIIYPSSNRLLYEKIVNGGGAVVSEFPEKMMVQKGLFIARNRIISGLSRGVLVVEGASDSGSLITARYAAEQGREVFAPPAPLTFRQSQAPNILLKQGAKMVTEVVDIFEEFNLKIIPAKKEDLRKNLTFEELAIINLLEQGPLLIDEIVLKSGYLVDKVLNLVSVLEIKGMVEKNKEGKYQIIS